MITPETMILVCEYVRRGCQVSEAVNKGYMKILDVELSDFSDDDFWAAARAIVRNETLYGKFPAVALWRKYSPIDQKAQIIARTERFEFLDMVEALKEKNESWSFSVENYKATKRAMWERFGERARGVVKQFGGCDRIADRLWAMKDNDYEYRRLIAEIGKAWDESAEVEALKLSAPKEFLQIEGK